MISSLIAAAAAASTGALSTGAAIQSADFDYTHMDVPLRGWLAKPAASQGLRPGLLIVHDWDGLDDYEKGRADQAARELGVAALAIDVYGRDTRPKTMAENAQFAGKYYADLPMFRNRIAAAYQALKEAPGVDQSRIAIMGYCFGGKGALEFARSGAPLAGAVSFHGGLDTSLPAPEGQIKCPILVIHASQDPVVPRPQFLAFIDEMTAAKADFQIVVYNLRAHAFTKPGGRDYNAAADRRSWAALTDFVGEIFPAARS